MPTPPPTSREVVAAAADVAARWMAFRRERLQVPGVQFAVRCEGELVHSSAHGWADVEHGVPLRTDHVFRVASHSKTFTAVAVLALADEGRLRLDDPLAQHVPWVAAADAELGRATLRELLGHAAGVTRDGVDGDFWQLEGEFLDADGLRGAVERGGSLVPRSSRFKYSNIGYSLLGLVVEAVTGTSYREHLATLTAPLGLSRTTSDLPAAGDLATGHSAAATGPRRPLRQPSTADMAAATGFCSTAEDLTAWFTSHVPGRPGPLSEHSRRLALRAEWTADEDVTYGLGFIGQPCGERRLVGHSGGFPGHITKSVVDPADGLAVTVLTNCIDGPAPEFALGAVKLVDLLRRHWSQEEPAADPAPFCGRWANLWGVLDVVRAGNRLLALDPDATDPTSFPTVLDVVDAHTLRVSGAGGFGDYAETWARGWHADGTPTLRGSSGITMVPLDRFAP